MRKQLEVKGVGSSKCGGLLQKFAARLGVSVLSLDSRPQLDAGPDPNEWVRMTVEGEGADVQLLAELAALPENVRRYTQL